MTDHKPKKQDERNSGVNSVAAAVTGAFVGAGVAVAATLALKNEKNQKKVKAVLSDIKEHAEEAIEKLKKKPDYNSGTEKIKEIVEDIKKIGK